MDKSTKLSQRIGITQLDLETARALAVGLQAYCPEQRGLHSPAPALLQWSDI